MTSTESRLREVLRTIHEKYKSKEELYDSENVTELYMAVRSYLCCTVLSFRRVSEQIYGLGLNLQSHYNGIVLSCIETIFLNSFRYFFSEDLTYALNGIKISGQNALKSFIREARAAKRGAGLTVSLDAYLPTDNDETLKDILPDNKPSPEQIYMDTSIVYSLVMEALTRLKTPQKKIAYLSLINKEDCKFEKNNIASVSAYIDHIAKTTSMAYKIPASEIKRHFSNNDLVLLSSQQFDDRGYIVLKSKIKKEEAKRLSYFRTRL